MAKAEEGERMQVRLTTSGGADVLAEPVPIPPFNKPPDVLLWGDRVFTFVRLDDGVALYVEAFAFWLPPTPDAKFPLPLARTAGLEETFQPKQPLERKTAGRQPEGGDNDCG